MTVKGKPHNSARWHRLGREQEATRLKWLARQMGGNWTHMAVWAGFEAPQEMRAVAKRLGLLDYVKQVRDEHALEIERRKIEADAATLDPSLLDLDPDLDDSTVDDPSLTPEPNGDAHDSEDDQTEEMDPFEGEENLSEGEDDDNSLDTPTSSE
jgi:hypothetical protein